MNNLSKIQNDANSAQDLGDKKFKKKTAKSFKKSFPFPPAGFKIDEEEFIQVMSL